MSIAALLDQDLVARRFSVCSRDVVYVRGILEASEGLAAMFAEHGGDLIIACHASRLRELDETLAELASELGIQLDLVPGLAC